MKTKKLLALLSALTMLGSLSPIGAMAENEGISLDAGYEFVDSAYSPTLGYMVAAKDYTKATSGNPLPVVLYNSIDGISWTKVHTDTQAYNNNNKYSRQQLEWWPGANAFVMTNGSTLKVSTNATTWTSYAGAARGNGVIATNGQDVVSVGGRAAKIVTPTNYTTTVQHHIFDPSSTETYVKAAGISPSGKILFASNNSFWYTDGAYDTATTNANFESVTKTTINAFSSLPVDMVYETSNQAWFTINNSTRMYKMTENGEQSNFVVIDNDTNISAIGVDDNAMIVGTPAGKLYYTSTSSDITSASAWTEITGAGLKDEVRTITSSGDGKFIVASKSAIFQISPSKGGYSYDVFKLPVEEKLEIGEATIDGSATAFDDVKLLGGAYSDKLGTYIVYGNTITPEAGDYGRIYTSKNGKSWTLSLKSQVKFNENSSDNAVWWDKAIKNEEGGIDGAFVVSCSTNGSGAGKVSYACWYSTDGSKWSYTTNLKLCPDGDIKVAGDYLYTAADGAVIRKISAMEADGTANIDEIAYTKPSSSFYARRIAVSDDLKYIMIAPSQGRAHVLDVETGTTTEFSTNASFSFTEIEYDAELGYWVLETSGEPACYGIKDNERMFTYRPYTTTGAKYLTFAKVGSKYVFGNINGVVFSGDVTTIAGKQQDYLEYATEAGKTANTKRIRDMFAGAEGKVVAVASDYTTSVSDILLVDVAGGTYKKASDNVAATANAGDELNITIPYTNTTVDSVSANLIVAVYSASGKLVQTNVNPVVLIETEDGELTQTVSVADDAGENLSLKVMLWTDELAPLTSSVIPFFK